MDMGLKGGIAVDANEQPILFNDGVGPSQMGVGRLRPEHSRRVRMLTTASLTGCNRPGTPGIRSTGTLSARRRTTSSPATRPAIPGAPWNDGRWPPIRCIKTRPTGSMNQLEKGFKLSFFGNANANPCPPAR